jgi:hypothetical protein
MPPALPQAEIIVPDMEASILRAMAALNEAIENLSSLEKPLTFDEGVKIFREMRLALGGKDIPAQALNTPSTKEFGVDSRTDFREDLSHSWKRWVESIETRVKVSARIPAKRMTELFVKICRANGLDIQRKKEKPGWGEPSRTIVISSGIQFIVSNPNDDWQNSLLDSQAEDQKPTGPPEKLNCEFMLSPELFSQNAQMIDQWRHKLGLKTALNIVVRFVQGTKKEPTAHKFTTKIFGSEIALNEDGSLRAMGIKFKLETEFANTYEQETLTFSIEKNLSDLPLPTLVDVLFQREVLWLEKEIRKKSR